tara:strand:+ start:2351 stop:2788 length:438 start_codon:yes stop_codon:yes gene_type:complete
MKPDINIALLNAAQEIINRFSPLIEDEYERSRLGSWGALILISAMKFNDSSSSLKKENCDIVKWLKNHTKLRKEELEKFESCEDKNLDQLDQDNQNLREILDKQIQEIQAKEDNVLFREGIYLMRSMHQRRKVSDLIGMLQQQES